MTDFLRELPDKWMLLSIVAQHPQGIPSFRLAHIAIQKDATTSHVNEVRNRMNEHQRHSRVRVFSNGCGDLIYKPKEKE